MPLTLCRFALIGVLPRRRIRGDTVHGLFIQLVQQADNQEHGGPDLLSFAKGIRWSLLPL
jgi:hypothetical protein